ATVSGGGEVRTNNDTAYDTTLVYPGVLIAPTNLVANAVSASQVSVMWDAVSTNKYQVFRSSNNGPYVLVGTPTASSFTDTGLTPNTTYLYQVKAVSDPNNVGPPSNIDLATTTIFLDDPIVAGSTLIRAIHLLQLRTAVNAVRAAAGMSNATFTNTIAPGVIISAIDVTELRSNLDAARSIIGVPALQYTDPTLTAGSTLVKAVHVQKLRSGVK
ncbi:MAG TPA: fibronectin type III domain-containing protein, partial [Thermoanaerobaculia bacterium]